MPSILKIFRFEFINTVTRRSFILSLILVPLIPTLIFGALRLLNTDQGQSLQQTIISEAANPLPIGIVDLSGVITTYPDWLTGSQLIPIPDLETARQKTAAGQLEGFYMISPDYLQTGQITLIKPQISMITELVQSNALETLLEYNLLNADQELYLKYTNPAVFTYQFLDPTQADTRDQNELTTFLTPYLVTLLFYMLVLISASLMLNAVTKDKENRVIEMLLTSAKPIHLFIGKIAALGTVSLIQMMVWFGTIILAMRTGGTVIEQLNNIQIPLPALLLSVPYFLLGFTLYGSLMAGMGAIAPNLKEVNQSTLVLTFPLIFTMLSINRLIQSPNDTFSTALSLIPLTSPVVMMTRLSISSIPLWQILTSLLLLAAMVTLTLRGVANLFKSQTLLTGQPIKPIHFLKAVFFNKSSTP